VIDEDDLRRLLDEAAAAAPPPGRGPEAVLEAAVGGGEPTPSRRRPRQLLAVAALVAVVVGGVALAERRDDGGQQVADGRGFGAAPSTTAPGGQTGSTAGSVAGTAPGADGATGLASSGATGAAASGAAGAPGAPVDAATTASPPAPAQAPAADTARVVKTGSLDLVIPEGDFAGTVDHITARATGLGGYVAESTTSEAGEAPRGSITVRVPSTAFDQLLTDLRQLGEVEAVTSRGTDVTAQFTDLAARLSALTATSDRFLEVLSGARNVGDIIAVQDRITGVQTDIEVLQGQQRLLEDQAGLGTLAVTLAEPGAEAVVVVEVPERGLGQAWDDARRRFGDGVEGLVAWSGSAAVVLVVGGVLLVVARVAWLRLRRRLV